VYRSKLLDPFVQTHLRDISLDEKRRPQATLVVGRKKVRCSPNIEPHATVTFMSFHPVLRSLLVFSRQVGNNPFHPLNVTLRPQQLMYLNDDANHVLTADELEYIVGQLTFGHDNRAGMDGSLHRISCIRNRSDRITGVTMRIGRCVPGNADIIRDLVHSEVCAHGGS
jgi:hypothetical protein